MWDGECHVEEERRCIRSVLLDEVEGMSLRDVNSVVIRLQKEMKRVCGMGIREVGSGVWTQTMGSHGSGNKKIWRERTCARL